MLDSKLAKLPHGFHHELPQASYPDEYIVQECVERRTNEQDCECCTEFALCLDISLSSLECSIPRRTEYQYLQILSGQSCGLFFRHNRFQDLRSEIPSDADWHSDGPQKIHHALELQSYQSFLACEVLREPMIVTL
jgi:hypothetical protein